MTRSLALAGAALPMDLLPPHPSHNPTGYWEPRFVVELNDEILGAHGGSWHSPPTDLEDVDLRNWAPRARSILQQQYGNGSTLALKDPRISLMLPFWRRVLLDMLCRPIFIIMLREPTEVAASLARRGDVAYEEGLEIWARYTLRAERDTRGAARVFVTFDDLLSDWRGVFGRLQSVAGEVLFQAENADRIDGFLSKRRKERGTVDATLRGCDLSAIYQVMTTMVDESKVSLTSLDHIWSTVDDVLPRRTRAASLAGSTSYRFGDLIELGLEKASRHLARGFSFREDWGRWTDGPLAVIEIVHGETSGLIFTELFVRRNFRRDGICDVILRSGRGQARCVSLDTDEARIVHLSQAEDAVDVGTLVIEIIVVRPKSSEEPPPDSRALGLGLASLRCTHYNI